MRMNRPVKQVHGGDIYSLARRLGLLEEQIIDFSASINPLGISPLALKAVRGALNRLDHYPDPQTTRLKERLSVYHHISPQRLLVGNGSTEFIYLLPRVLKPKKVLIVSPTFTEYERASRLSGAAVHHVWSGARDEFRISVEKIYRGCQKGIDLLFLCNPNNPTGQLLSREEVLWLVKRVSRMPIQVVVDEAFIDYEADQSILSTLSTRDGGDSDGTMTAHPNLVVVRSFTKFFGLSGLRVGYLVAQPGLCRKLGAAKEPWSVNTLAQIAAGESLLDTTYIKESLRFMEIERPTLISSLSSIQGITLFPSHANFVLIRIVGQGDSSQGISGYLASQGLLVRDCQSFKGLGSGYIRVAIKREEENRRLYRLVRKVIGSNCLKAITA